MSAPETPAPASPSSGQAVQLEATNAAENLDMLKDIDDGLALDKPWDSRRDDPLTVVKAVHDPEGQYSAEPVPHYNGQNAPLALVPDSALMIQTGNSTDQVYEDYFQTFEFVPEKDQDYLLISYKIKDRFEDCDTNYNIKHKGVDEDDQVDGKSSDQNIPVLGTKATDKAESATLSEKWLQQDFSPTATTPNDISVLELTTNSSEPLQKPEEVEEEGVSVDDVDHTSFSVEPDPDSQIVQNPMGTELVSQIGDVVNIVTVHDKAKEDEVCRMGVFQFVNNRVLPV